jgi:hypothetical protein
MTEDSEEQEARLQDLLKDLDACRRRDGEERSSHYEEQLPHALKQVERLPLFHGTNIDAFFSAFSVGELRCRAAVRSDLPEAQRYLGLGEWVYTSAGVLYPNRVVAIVLGPHSEAHEKVAASPWDTGAFCHHLCPQLSPMPGPERRQHFQRHTLPSPAWRQYMGHYVASCFGSFDDYLESRPHKWADPLGALSSDRFSRVFEVRFQVRIPLTSDTLVALFIPRNAGGRKMLALRTKLSLLGPNVHVDYYPAAERLLPQRVRAWMQPRFEAGASP